VVFPRFSFAWTDTISGVAFIGTALSLVIAQIYRYRRVSTQLQRQQTKFVIYGLAVTVLLSAVANFLESLFPSLFQIGSLFASLSDTVYSLLLFLIPVSIGIAILRYRLWDIDALINKTLVYGSLTGVLGALYAGLIIGLTSLAGALTGGKTDQQPVALVIATLAIAALFLPVRRRIQNLIDQRFYRRKYDAEKTLAAFSAMLQSEVDLEQLREQVLAVVQATMQPAHVSLWLRQPERHPSEQAHRLEPQGPSTGTDDER
jgi:hypothetical protein